MNIVCILGNHSRNLDLVFSSNVIAVMSERIVTIKIKILNLNFTRSVNTKKIKQNSIIEKKAALSPDNSTNTTEERMSNIIFKSTLLLFLRNII